MSEQISSLPEECKGGKKCATYVCYTLRSVVAPARTYSGSTNNFVHRFRQHNGIITGGARATHTDRPWRVCSIIYGFESRANALRFEYFTKVKHNKAVYHVRRRHGWDSLSRRASLILAAELKMKPEQRSQLKYYVPDSYFQRCLEEAKEAGVPGTVEAAWKSAAPPPETEKTEILIVDYLRGKGRSIARSCSFFIHISQS